MQVNTDGFPLPENLRKLAEIYFDSPSKIEVEVGICYNLMVLVSDRNVYYSMEILMKHLGIPTMHFEDSNGRKGLGSIKKWQSRAYMCLFLAEYLETKEE